MTDFVALLLVIVGIASLATAKRRRFDRTNKYGVERFPSFSAKLRARSADHVLVGGGATAIAVGTIGLAINHFDGWGWIIMAPVVVVMLYLLLGTQKLERSDGNRGNPSSAVRSCPSFDLLLPIPVFFRPVLRISPQGVATLP